MKNNGHRIAPLKITRSTPEPEPVAPQLDTEEADLERQLEEIEQKKQGIADKKREAQEAEYNRQLDKYNALREDSANFRASAAKEPDEASKRTYLRWAIEADKEALALARELGLDIPADLEEPTEAPKATDQAGGKRMQVFFQMALLIGIIFLAYNSFVGYGESIKAKNALLPVEQQMSPYDATSIQKFFLEKFYEFFDLPLALVKLLIFAPFVLFYALPFVRTRKNLITEFYDDLTPYQRCVITISLLSLFLLHSALSHLVKP